MGLRQRKFVSVAVFGVFAAGLFALVLGCNAPTGPQIGSELPQTPDGDTRLVIGIHGTPPPAVRNAHAISGIEALLLSVYRIDLRGPGGWIRLLQEDLVVDILAASRMDPVILSDVSVEPGFYSELRLVLNQENRIRVNGVYHPLRIPGGTSSGLKLKGDFYIPAGRLFNLNVELDTARSVSWNQGTGYRLHPVLRISSGPYVIGIFRGNLTLHGGVGGGETLVQLFDDGTARVRSTRFPNFTIWANYNYNSVTRILRLDDINLDAPGLRRRRLNRIMRELPDHFLLPIRQWSLDSIIAVDAMGVTANLYRVDEFSFSRGVSFTEVVIHIDIPGSPRIGSDVVTEIQFIDTGHTKTLLGTFEGGRVTKMEPILNDMIQGSSTRIQITSFLLEDPDALDTKMVVFANVPTLLMTSSHVSASSDNPWQPPVIFTLRRDIPGQEFTVPFPGRMNIRMDHGNFTNNNPVVSWDPSPGANGYFMLAVVRNRDFDPNIESQDGNRFFIPAFYYFTMGTSAIIDSELISFTQVGSQPARINPGDIIRIEVYALDGSGFLDSVNRQGALLMDAVTIRR